MAAFLALGKTLGDDSADLISSFLYHSRTIVPTCGTGASDIANVADLSDINRGIYRDTWSFCYEDSLEMRPVLYIDYPG